MKNRVVKVEDVISLIDKQVEFLKQQNGVGALMGVLKMFDADNVKNVVDKNNETIKELTKLRMRVLELSL